VPGAAGGSTAQFEDATEKTGIAFEHFSGATGEKYLPETLGSGVCAFDFDDDGWTDLYFVNGAPLPPGGAPSGPANVLYRNRGDGTFEDVTARSGTGDTGYGIGCAAGDFDADGFPDLYVANFGPNVLYRNRGDGTFEDVSGSSGTGDPSFSTGATFLDADGDGDLDLFVLNYMVYRLEENKYCGEVRPGFRAYCGPDVYPGAPDRLYRNEGAGRFRDVTSEAGVEGPDGRGLGVVAFDPDDDRDADLYVANDGMANFFFRNEGGGRFREVGLLTGTALGDEGTAQAGMGVDFADYDADGRMDLFVANLTFQPSALYRNAGDGTFDERSFPAGVAGPTQLMTGYGCGFFDFDNDGWIDLYEANGHMMDNVELYHDNITFPEPGQIFRNRGDGTFEDVGGRVAPAFAEPRVGRGSALLDFDRDGNLDLVLVAAGAKARLFRNRGSPGSHHLDVLLRGAGANREGIGAKVRVAAGGRIQVQEAKGASGYASQSERTIHFGLGPATAVEWLEIRWASGVVDRIVSPPVDGVVQVAEGSNRAEPLRTRR
jgi:hypothetical protein